MAETLIDRFASAYPFDLDPFQITAAEALERGESVLIAAPTGSGKTVVGEFAVWLALQEGRKAFYTTPLKALSNQKFADFVSMHGADKVGLLTGDNVINSGAPIVVMTTEVLRNMIYERSSLLEDLHYVVLDEVHYLQDRYRGAVWEEVIIHLPLDIEIVCLSATVSNAEEFADWIQTIRGPTTAIIEEKRPVDLEQFYLLNNELFPMFTGPKDEPTPNPQVKRLETRSSRPTNRRGGRSPERRPRRFPKRTDVVELLASEGMLPAIYFIFSRKGCDMAVAQCMREGRHLNLNSPSEKARIREVAEMRCAYLDQGDLSVLGYDDWIESLCMGFASHHAGLIPVFKETVEELFQAGLVKVVFATETLSLGINMPAKTVVIESLNKFTGERHEMLTPGEFTQLTGRAGRRGIDVLGYAVIPQQREIPFHQIAGLASTRTYPLISSFQPSYNMATNLIRNYSREQAEHLLNSSFAQYRADKDVVVLERLVDRNEAYLASYREKMACDRGDFWEYWSLKEKASLLERSLARWEQTAGREKTRTALALARPGQVFVMPEGRNQGPMVVVGTDSSRKGDPRITVVTSNRRVARLGPQDFPKAPKVVGRIEVSRDLLVARKHSGPKVIDHESRRQLADSLQKLDLPPDAWKSEPLAEEREGGEMAQAADRLQQHPCHECPDLQKHSQWAERAARLDRENEGLTKRIRSRTETISRKFDRVLSVLEEFDYVRGFDLTAKGQTLTRIYNENDLLVSEILVRGGFNDLTADEAAALSSTFVFESRGPFEISGDLPSAKSKKAYGGVVRMAERIGRAERRADLELTRGTEAGFAKTAYLWCRGADLDDVIDPEGTPGDFIRWSKQTIDLLRQLDSATQDPRLKETFEEAIDGLNRGVVAYTGLS